MNLAFSPLDVLIPIIVALLKQSGFDRNWNAWVAIVVYIVWTAVSLTLGLRAVPGPVTFEVFLSALVSSAATGFVSYQLFWKTLGEQRLEQKTSVYKGPISEPVVTGLVEPDPLVRG